jgi:hypothetical protein
LVERLEGTALGNNIETVAESGDELLTPLVGNVDGAMEGVNVGTTELGVGVGPVDGIGVGSTEGRTDGELVEILEGASLGNNIETPAELGDELLAPLVGNVDGAMEGVNVGTTELGVGVGPVDGIGVGSTEGRTDGELVEILEGASLGNNIETPAELGDELLAPLSGNVDGAMEGVNVGATRLGVGVGPAVGTWVR